MVSAQAEEDKEHDYIVWPKKIKRQYIKARQNSVLSG